MSDVELRIVEGEEAAARAVAERLAEQARRGGSVVLTGGSTPKRAYELAAELAPDWSGVELWWGDERCVAPEDERSNYGMAKAALLERLREPPAPVHRMKGELGRDAGADEYERALDGVGTFDLVLLGLGPDGHVASLFPGQPALDEERRSAIGNEPGLEPFVDRITLTLPRLRDAREVWFLVAGESKAEAVTRAFAQEPSKHTPSSLVRAAHGPTIVVLDRAAAAKL
jgi:6-phosphogluconolactonase